MNIDRGKGKVRNEGRGNGISKQEDKRKSKTDEKVNMDEENRKDDKRQKISNDR